ncbi:MAG: hypothetical protein AAFQ18_01160 [Pseudomonadota bacterium]
MIRLLFLTLLVASLASCAQYREPRANCFSFAALTEDADPCDFHLLDGQDRAAVIDA